MALARGWQRIEGALVFAGALVLLARYWDPFLGWLLIPAFFAPDLSILAYVAGPRAGALAYNAVHVYGFGLMVLAIGVLTNLFYVEDLGFLWLAHAGFDRMLGYGLKLDSGFRDTHLGRIGRG